MTALPDLADLTTQQQQQQIRVDEARQSLANHNRVRGQTAAQFTALQQQLSQAQSRRLDAASILQQREQEVEASKQRAASYVSRLRGVQQLAADMEEEWGDDPGWPDDDVDGGQPVGGRSSRGGGGSRGGSSKGEVDAAAISSASRRLRQLRLQLDKAGQLRVGGGTGSTTEEAAAAARVDRVAAISKLAQALASEIDGLEADVAKGATQVAAAHDAVADDVAAGFRSMAGSLLPSVEFDLVRVGRQAHEGLRITFRQAAGTGASRHNSRGEEPWRSDLAALSGGQRTLVSLALLLSTARASGGGGSGLYILDEADAALDEHNQVRSAHHGWLVGFIDASVCVCW